MFLFRLILFPFELLGQVIAWTAGTLWKLAVGFLFSPWGLIVPLTLLAMLFLSAQLAQTTKQLTESYADELESCDETKIPTLIDNLVRLGDYGISGLVRGLQSSRESVYIACRDTLRSEMDRWDQLPTAERVRQFRILSEALLDRATEFGPTAKNETILFARKILHNLVASRTNNPNNSTQSSNSQLATQNCERFLSLVKAERTKKPAAGDLLDTESEFTEEAARLGRRNLDTPLMTAQGMPFQPEKQNELTQPEYIAATNSGDSLSMSRAERLYAYHQSPQYQKQLETPYRRPGLESLPAQSISIGNDPTEMLASMTPVQNIGTKITSVLPGTDVQRLGEVATAEPDGKIARNYIEKNTAKTDSTRTRPPESDLLAEADGYLPWELRDLPLEKVPGLSSARLMQLLHHSDDRYVTEARRTLIARDGFQDAHLKLAYRLFHPAASVRMEIISILPNTSGIRPDVWLSVLLSDSDNEVRYRAASFLATAGDPAMQRLVIDKGKRDSDTRIVNLADRLLEQQRHKVQR